MPSGKPLWLTQRFHLFRRDISRQAAECHSQVIHQFRDLLIVQSLTKARHALHTFPVREVLRRQTIEHRNNQVLASGWRSVALFSIDTATCGLPSPSRAWHPAHWSRYVIRPASLPPCRVLRHRCGWRFAHQIRANGFLIGCRQMRVLRSTTICISSNALPCGCKTSGEEIAHIVRRPATLRQCFRCDVRCDNAPEFPPCMVIVVSIWPSKPRGVWHSPQCPSTSAR